MEKAIKKVKEDDIQKWIFAWAEANSGRYPELKTLYHIPNEGMRTFAQTNWLKSLGMKKGVPDICLPVRRRNYGALYIELKTPKGRLSKEQKEWIDLLNRTGNLAVVCRCFEEAISTIEVYLK